MRGQSVLLQSGKRKEILGYEFFYSFTVQRPIFSEILEINLNKGDKLRIRVILISLWGQQDIL